MGLSIGSNCNVRKIALKNADGSVSGTISITNAGKNKKKKVQYNFKEISTLLMRAKTSGNASQVASKARSKVAELRKMEKSGEYDDKELEAAIMHAEQMERVAKKRAKHLQEEESVKTSGGVCAAELDENESIDWEDIQNQKTAEPDMEEAMERMQEFQELMQETMDETMEKAMQEMQDSMQQMLEDSGLEELTEELTVSVSKEMDPADFEQLKRKHRADELRDIAEADRKYLKAIFDKLERDKQNAAAGVSLELGGVEMPVTTAVESAPVVTEGGAVDVSV